MTDRYNGLVVVLEQDIRDDDAEHIINAIKMLRGVLSVAGNVSDMASHIAQERADRQWRDRLHKLLWPDRE